MADRVVDPGMRAYYDRRAFEYDDWWLGTRTCDRRDRPGWREDVMALVEVLRGLSPARTLDVACGTGFLTRHLPGEVTGLDQSLAMVALAATRMPGGRVVRGEAVPLPFPDGAFERVVTAHFYGHLLVDERAAFLAEARRVARELVVVDTALHDGVSEEAWEERVLGDGSRHRVFKRCFTGPGLAAELGAGSEVLHEGPWFLVVRAAPSGLASRSGA